MFRRIIVPMARDEYQQLKVLPRRQKAGSKPVVKQTRVEDARPRSHGQREEEIPVTAYRQMSAVERRHGAGLAATRIATAARK